MDFSFLGELAKNGVDFASKLTGFLGEGEASLILKQVGEFLKTINFEALGNFLTSALGFIAKLFG